MAKKIGNDPYTEAEYSASVDPAFKALLVQQTTVHGNGENPYELLNNLLKKQRSKRLYSNGTTKPMSGLALHLEAERDVGHSSKLWRNMRNSGNTKGQSVTKSSGCESHHVVASRAPDAHIARRIMFGVGIGINDARNGVNLHRIIHHPLHSDSYYVEVNTRLLTIEDALKLSTLADKEAGVGEELRDMAKDMENGTF